MHLLTLDNVIKNPNEYLEQIKNNEFRDIEDAGENKFKNIQFRNLDDEFAKYMLSAFPGYAVNWNFVRKSPLNQEEPNFIHTDEMMGDITCILYLNKEKPNEDGTTIYDEDKNPLFVLYSKFNRMIAFSSESPHSRNILENFGDEESARLIQVIFLKQI